jgi:hypothetical protein
MESYDDDQQWVFLLKFFGEFFLPLATKNNSSVIHAKNFFTGKKYAPKNSADFEEISLKLSDLDNR